MLQVTLSSRTNFEVYLSNDIRKLHAIQRQIKKFAQNESFPCPPFPAATFE